MVLKIKRTSTKRDWVEGDTGLGMIQGVWEGRSAPEINEDYDVELGLPEPSEIRVLSAHEPRYPGVQIVENNHLRFTAPCEAVDEDNTIVLRFAINWLDFIHSEGFVCKAGEWIEFTAPISQVGIYPIEG